MELQNQKNTAAKRNGNEVLVTDDAIIMPDWFHEEKAEWDKPKERPPCPNCGSRPIGNGSQWMCNDCGKQWVKNPQPKVDMSLRPDCPVCGNKPRKHGASWECQTCGKNWVKRYRREPINFSERPSCPLCNGKPRSNGRRWVCRSCGKGWYK